MVLYLTLATACSNPTLSSTSFTTQDATILSNIAYVSQFKLECDGEPADIPLFAEVGGKPLSVVKSKETNEYLVSGWRKLRKLPVVILKSKSTLMKVMLLFARLNVAEKTHRQSLLWALYLSTTLVPTMVLGSVLNTLLPFWLEEFSIMPHHQIKACCINRSFTWGVYYF